MIAVFAVRDSFSLSEETLILQRNCRAFAAEFPDEICEFFYYLKPDEAERWFFIRARTRDKGKFVEVAEQFAENLDFSILLRGEARKLLREIDLDLFV